MFRNRRSPKIPASLKESFTQITISTGGYDGDTGNYVPGTESTLNFKGAVLPLTEDDLAYANEGRFTEIKEKLYVDESIATFLDGSTVTRISSGEVFQVYAIRDYGFTAFRRYFLKKEGAAINV